MLRVTVLSTTPGFPLPVPFLDSSQEKELYLSRIHEVNEPFKVLKLQTHELKPLMYSLNQWFFTIQDAPSHQMNQLVRPSASLCHCFPCEIKDMIYDCLNSAALEKTPDFSHSKHTQSSIRHSSLLKYKMIVLLSVSFMRL